MERLTSDYVQRYISDLSARSCLSLNLVRTKDGYLLTVNGVNYCEGTLKEIYIFSRGFECAISHGKLGVSQNKVPVENKASATQSKSNSSVSLKTLVESSKGMRIEVKRITEDMYFSQHKFVYMVSFINVNNNVVNCDVTLNEYTEDGIPIATSKPHVGMFVKLKGKSEKDMAFDIIKQFDAQMFTDLKEGFRDKNKDYIMWITIPIMRTLGWTNKGLLTKDVKCRTSFY